MTEKNCKINANQQEGVYERGDMCIICSKFAKHLGKKVPLGIKKIENNEGDSQSAVRFSEPILVILRGTFLVQAGF